MHAARPVGAGIMGGVGVSTRGVTPGYRPAVPLGREDRMRDRLQSPCFVFRRTGTFGYLVFSSRWDEGMVARGETPGSDRGRINHAAPTGRTETHDMSIRR